MDTESLLVDSSRINGEVTLIVMETLETIRTVPIARDATFFNGVSQGWFVYRDKAEGWWYGHVGQPGKERKINAIGDDATYVAPAPDGSRLAVATQAEPKSRLLVLQLGSGSESEVFTRAGIISVPAWSPASDAIVFYFVPPDLLLDDAFSLELVALDNGEAKLQTVAPPSGYTGLTAARTQPPRWSPDGTRILFSANYEASDRIEPIAYVVGRDGGGAERVEGGVWESTGQALLTIRRKSLPFGDFVLSRYSPSTHAAVDTELPFDLPKSVAGGAWKPDGTRFAYISGDGELIIVDLVAKRQFLVTRAPEGAKLSWIAPSATR